MSTYRRTSCTRRQMLRNTGLAGVGLWLAGGSRQLAAGSANEKLNIACVGLGNQGNANVGLVAGENIVALCDVDASRVAMFANRFPSAKCFADFRVMLDKMERHIDAVVVTTPNHSHAVISIPAMKMGKHVYCEKPLAHTIHEIRAMQQAAAESKVVTQLGTQIHAGSNYRRTVELIRAGAIGAVRKVHVWFGKPGGFKRYEPLTERPTEKPPVPEGLDWDLWTGPAPMRPYHPCYHPHDWHYWWHFGNGEMGNMAPHFFDLAFWALDLGAPESVEATGPPVHPDSTPFWLDCAWRFPARAELPPVEVTWHDGRGCPAAVRELLGFESGAGVLFVGDKGMLLANYTERKLLPEEDFAGYQPPEPTIPDSVGCQRKEWIEACKGNGEALCSFDYGGPLTEVILLGNIAYRTGKTLRWDAAKMTFPNHPEADQYLRQEHRSGWHLS
ncbi:MAG: Gfo/Idh/MocA family oxidoreductase [Patescibacteria group bacterium]|nr:Gfo/Idh/MocA family oxidoreductase [Patescibacteria group bacterium]